MLSLETVRKQLIHELQDWQQLYLRPQQLLGQGNIDDNFQKLIANLFPVRPLLVAEQNALALLESARAFLTIQPIPADNLFYVYYQGHERPEKPRFSLYLLMQAVLLNENLSDFPEISLVTLEDSIASLANLSQAIIKTEGVDAQDALDIAIETDSTELLEFFLAPRLQYRLDERLEALFIKARARENPAALNILIYQSAKCYEHGISVHRTQRFLALLQNVNELLLFYQVLPAESIRAFFDTLSMDDLQPFIATAEDMQCFLNAMSVADKPLLLTKLSSVAQRLNAAQILALLAYKPLLEREQFLLALNAQFSHQFSTSADFYSCLKALDFRVTEGEPMRLDYTNIHMPEALREAYEAAVRLNQVILAAELAPQHKLKYLLLTRQLLTVKAEKRGLFTRQYLAHVHAMEREINCVNDRARYSIVVLFLNIFRFLGIISPSTLTKDAKTLSRLAKQDASAFVFPLSEIVTDLDAGCEAVVLHAMQDKQYAVFWAQLSDEQISNLFLSPLRLAKLLYQVDEQQALFEGLGPERLGYFVRHHQAWIQKIQSLPKESALAFVKAIGSTNHLVMVNECLVQLTAMVFQLNTEHCAILFDGLSINAKSRLTLSNEKLALFLNGLSEDKYLLVIEKLNLSRLLDDFPRLSGLVTMMDEGKAPSFCLSLMPQHAMSLANILTLIGQLAPGSKRLLVARAFLQAHIQEFATRAMINDASLSDFVAIIKLLPPEGQEEIMNHARPFLIPRLSSVTALSTLMLMFNDGLPQPALVNVAQLKLLQIFNGLPLIPVRSAAEFVQAFSQNYIYVAQRRCFIETQPQDILQDMIRDGLIDTVLRCLDNDESNKVCLLHCARRGLENIQDTRLLIDVLNDRELNILCDSPLFLKSKTTNLLDLVAWLRTLTEAQRDLIVSRIIPVVLEMCLEGEQLHAIFLEMPTLLRSQFFKCLLQLNPDESALFLNYLQSRAFSVLRQINPGIYEQVLAKEVPTLDTFTREQLSLSQYAVRDSIKMQFNTLHLLLGDLYKKEGINKQAGPKNLLAGLVQWSSQGLFTSMYQVLTFSSKPDYASLCRQTIEQAFVQVALLKKAQTQNVLIDELLPIEQEGKCEFDRLCKISDQLILKDQHEIKYVLDVSEEALKRVTFRCNIDKDSAPMSCLESLEKLIEVLNEIKTNEVYHHRVLRPAVP